MRGTWWHAWNPRMLLNLVATRLGKRNDSARLDAAPRRDVVVVVVVPGWTPRLDANQAIPGIIRSGFIMAYQFRGKHRGALSDREKIGRERGYEISSSSGSVSSLLVIRTWSRQLLSSRQVKAFLPRDSPEYRNLMYKAANSYVCKFGANSANYIDLSKEIWYLVIVI